MFGFFTSNPPRKDCLFNHVQTPVRTAQRAVAGTHLSGELMFHDFDSRNEPGNRVQPTSLAHIQTVLLVFASFFFFFWGGAGGGGGHFA